jgi:hypothetical protein
MVGQLAQIDVSNYSESLIGLHMLSSAAFAALAGLNQNQSVEMVSLYGTQNCGL